MKRLGLGRLQPRDHGNHVSFFLKQLLSRLSVWVRDDMLCSRAKVVSIFFVQHKMFAFLNNYSQMKIMDVYLYFTWSYHCECKLILDNPNAFTIVTLLVLSIWNNIALDCIRSWFGAVFYWIKRARFLELLCGLFCFHAIATILFFIPNVTLVVCFIMIYLLGWSLGKHNLLAITGGFFQF